MTSKSPYAPTRARLRARLSAAFALGLGGCATMPPPILPPRDISAMEMVRRGSTAMEPEAAASAGGAEAATGQPVAAKNRLFQVPTPPAPGKVEPLPSSAGTMPPADPTLETAVSIEQLPLPAFIDTVFATILKRNISVDPSIAQRKELVSLKSGKPQTAQGLYEAAVSVLKSFNIAVTEYNGLLRITPGTGPTGFVPELRMGRSLPEVPSALRPIFQIVDLEAVNPATVAGWLRTLFGQRLQVQEDLGGQAILLSGQSDDVAAAVDAIKSLDRPLMRGRASARIAPLFWSADEMAKRLAEVLQAQGYSVGTMANAQAPIILLPIPPLNSVLVFARSEAILNYVLRWATDLDQPASGRGSAGYFTYAVRNLDASELAKTLQDVMNPAGTSGAGAGATRSRVVVNAASNTLIIQGNPTEYQQWFGLLQELDRPPRSALISVTIAEVTLNASEQLGFEWMLNQFQSAGNNVNVSTLGSFGTSAIGGLAAVVTAGNGTTPRALFNALASTSRVRVLANPSIMARNGEMASIQVGSEVPVISSQQTTGTAASTSSNGGTTLQNGLLQTIQYRSTGVILKVKPVIHAGGRIDLDVDQEVSSASATQSGVTSSPTIATRHLTTKLSVTDGATVLLGGLMQETASNTDTGVPWLKDIPWAGNLFKSHHKTRDRTELIVLITPYVINDEFEAHSITAAFRNQFTWDSDTTEQHLRPPQVEPAPTAPRNGLEDAIPAPKPYILPPPPPSAPTSGEAASAPSTTTPKSSPSGLGTRPDFGNTTTKTTSPLPKTGATGPDAPRAAAGTPVTDPKILKELQDAIRRP
ncbi:MAG: hypothetical protein KGL18_08385 [Burkholderiales bacterium]|nr:hypothetical protein [Burkholderiales bacterium]MDE1925898.1 hypothetical protein [Burkholderiales bacterium]MDE2502976.1 hypothetical protein [Burkholderiales bacterium]